MQNYDFQASLDYRVRSYLKQINKNEKRSNQTYWSIILRLERLRQENYKFQVSLGFTSRAYFKMMK